jgi:regulator of protease activity HflC (stomatin/prohibitin superfamily)
MILQAEAERKKRASILTSEGDRQAAINLSKAKREKQILTA